MNAAFWAFIALVLFVIAIVVIAVKLGRERQLRKIKEQQREETERIVNHAQTVYSELNTLSDDQLDDRLRQRGHDSRSDRSDSK
jgi:flagellar biosynthesis/type III secretory pathway M-ring protein FliF/YscJ